MENKVKAIIARVLNVDPVVITDGLCSGDIPEWDSVGNLAIISTLEQELEIEFPLDICPVNCRRSQPINACLMLLTAMCSVV